MPSESEQCVAAFFHASRKLAKQKPVGEAPAWMQEWAETEYRKALADWVANWMAERDDWERTTGC